MIRYRVKWTGVPAYELVVEETTPERAIAWVRKQHELVLDLLVRHAGADPSTFSETGRYTATRQA